MELIKTDYTGDVVLVKDILNLEDDVLAVLSQGESVDGYTFVEELGDGSSHGFERRVFVFEHQGEHYKFLAVSTFAFTKEPVVMFTKPFRVFMSEQTRVSKTYSQRLTQRDDAERIEQLEQEGNK